MAWGGGYGIPRAVTQRPGYEARLVNRNARGYYGVVRNVLPYAIRIEATRSGALGTNFKNKGDGTRRASLRCPKPVLPACINVTVKDNPNYALPRVALILYHLRERTAYRKYKRPHTCIHQNERCLFFTPHARIAVRRVITDFYRFLSLRTRKNQGSKARNPVVRSHTISRGWG